MGWNYLSIPKLQQCNRWSLGMDKLFHPTLHCACDYLSMMGLKLFHVNKRGPWCHSIFLSTTQWWRQGTSKTFMTINCLKVQRLPPHKTINLTDDYNFKDIYWTNCTTKPGNANKLACDDFLESLSENNLAQLHWGATREKLFLTYTFSNFCWPLGPHHHNFGVYSLVGG